MKITIYQIIPELDQDRLIFMPLSYFQKAGYPSPPAEIYESVFCGETEVATLEEIYRIFNRKDEADAFGFSQIAFQKENAMLPVQNHDNIPFEQVNRSKPGYLAYMDNGGISIHPCIQVQLQRCKYSQCQLGYRLRYQEKEESPWRQRDFLERPAVLLFEDTQKEPCHAADRPDQEAAETYPANHDTP